MPAVTQLLPALLLLGVSIPSTHFMYMQARTAVLGEVVCEHPPPLYYCALTRNGLFELPLGPDGYGVWCPATPQPHSLRYQYLVRPTIQWLPLTVGRNVCWVVQFFRKMQPSEPLTRQALRPASARLRKCDRSNNDHIMITPLDELAVEGDGTLYLSIDQDRSHKPAEVLGVFVDVKAVYD